MHSVSLWQQLLAGVSLCLQITMATPARLPSSLLSVLSGITTHTSSVCVSMEMLVLRGERVRDAARGATWLVSLRKRGFGVAGCGRVFPRRLAADGERSKQSPHRQSAVCNAAVCRRYTPSVTKYWLGGLTNHLWSPRYTTVHIKHSPNYF